MNLVISGHNYINRRKGIVNSSNKKIEAFTVLLGASVREEEKANEKELFLLKCILSFA